MLSVRNRTVDFNLPAARSPANLPGRG